MTKSNDDRVYETLETISGGEDAPTPTDSAEGLLGQMSPMSPTEIIASPIKSISACRGPTASQRGMPVHTGGRDKTMPCVEDFNRSVPQNF